MQFLPKFAAAVALTTAAFNVEAQQVTEKIRTLKSLDYQFNDTPAPIDDKIVLVRDQSAPTLNGAGNTFRIMGNDTVYVGGTGTDTAGLVVLRAKINDAAQQKDSRYSALGALFNTTNKWLTVRKQDGLEPGTGLGIVFDGNASKPTILQHHGQTTTQYIPSTGEAQAAKEMMITPFMVLSGQKPVW